PVFSPDGKTVAYAAKEGGKWLVVVGEKRGRSFDAIMFSEIDWLVSIVREAPTIIFSPDGKKVAYVGFDGNRAFVVAGDTISSAFDSVGGLCVGGGFGYTQKGQSMLLPPTFVVTVGETVRCKGSPFVFSPDGSKIAFGARTGTELWWKVMQVP
ncbi:MAG: hypothetical protein QXH03_09445, partial [Candidatus Bathyarchaeia archaeon]